jgi:hypothetical protein
MFAMLSANAVQANTNTTLSAESVIELTQAFTVQARAVANANKGLSWTVGDTTNYNLDAGFIKGTAVITVREETEEGFWLNQDLELGMAGQQKVEILLDKNTGEVKRIIVNGKEQEKPEVDMEVISMDEDKITVPAGTFECIHVVIRDKTKNEDSDAWVNPQLIPINGLLKNVSPGQMGKVTLELTSFKWAK